ncbi:MAG: hypothetical protein ACYCZH_02785, partial [Sulfuriferula sp.]
LQDALARIPAHAASPSGVLPKKNQDCTDSAKNYRWGGWSLTLQRAKGVEKILRQQSQAQQQAVDQQSQ